MSEQKKPRIPEFSSLEEEAQFWDTHDITEFEDEFHPVQVRFAKKLSKALKSVLTQKQRRSCEKSPVSRASGQLL